MVAVAGCDAKQGNAATNAPRRRQAGARRPKVGTGRRSSARRPKAGFVMGNPDAKLKLIEYGSLTCPHCREFDEKGVPALIDNYVKTGQVSWEFRNYVRDAFDLTAALVARCNGAKQLLPADPRLLQGPARMGRQDPGDCRRRRSSSFRPAARPAVRRASPRSPASRTGRRRAASPRPRPTSAWPTRSRQPAGPDDQRRDQPISGLPGHADLHHQRQDARQDGGLGAARAAASSAALGERG